MKISLTLLRMLHDVHVHVTAWCRWIMSWLKTVLHNVKFHALTLTEAVLFWSGIMQP